MMSSTDTCHHRQDHMYRPSHQTYHIYTLYYNIVYNNIFCCYNIIYNNIKGRLLLNLLLTLLIITDHHVTVGLCHHRVVGQFPGCPWYATQKMCFAFFAQENHSLLNVNAEHNQHTLQPHKYDIPGCQTYDCICCFCV